MNFIVTLGNNNENDEAPESSSTDDAQSQSPSVASGKKVVQELKSKLTADSDLLSLQIVDLDTLICQNDCSGHGTCHQGTRSCVCEAFWIENFVRRYLMDGKSNCGKCVSIFIPRAVNRQTPVTFRMVSHLRGHFSEFAVGLGFVLHLLRFVQEEEKVDSRGFQSEDQRQSPRQIDVERRQRPKVQSIGAEIRGSTEL